MEERQLSFGDVVNGTFSVIAEHATIFAAFVGGMTILGTAVEWAMLARGSLGALGNFQQYLGLGAGLGGLILFVVAIVAQYLVWETVISKSGLVEGTPGRRYLAFLGQGILIGLATGFGFLLLIVPGLIFSARWAMAPALLIIDRQGITEAMGNSWESVTGNTTPVALAILVGGVAVSVVGGGSAFIAGSPTVGFGVGATAISQLASQVGSALMIALGVYLYRELWDSSHLVTDVFR